jgi:hypothetical protein
MGAAADILAFSEGRVIVFVLALARVAGLFIMGPIFAALGAARPRGAGSSSRSRCAVLGERRRLSRHRRAAGAGHARFETMIVSRSAWSRS